MQDSLRGNATCDPSRKPIGCSLALPQAQGSPRVADTPELSHKPIGYSPDLPQGQGSPCAANIPDPRHRFLGFSPDLPQVQGLVYGSINLGPNHEPMGFSPDLPQIQGSPCRAVNLDSSYRLLGFCQGSLMAQGSLNSDANPGPEQYQIHSDDDDCSPTSNAEDYFCWEQSWVDLHEPPKDWSSANAGPGILRMPVHEPGAQACRSSTARVTWHVPLEISSVWSPECKTARLDLSPGPACFGRPIAWQVPGSSISFLPTLACTFMYRLLTLQVSHAHGTGRQFEQPTCNLVISGATCWRPLPRSCMRSVLPAPSRPRSTSFLKDTLPGSTSVSENDSCNVLVLTCIKTRWGETSSPDMSFKTSSPDSSFQISRCAEPGRDPSPRSVRFSPSPCVETGQRDLQEPGKDPNPKLLGFSSRFPRASEGASAQVAQVGQAQTGQEGLSQGIDVAKEQAEPGCPTSVPAGAYKDLVASAWCMPGSVSARKDQADSARLMPGPLGAHKDQVGQRAQVSDQVSGATPNAMPQVSGDTPNAMSQVSGATPNAMPQVSGATSNAMHQTQVSGATSDAMPQPQVSGATSDAMHQPQVSGATSDAMPQPQVSGATSDAMPQPQVSGATSDAMPLPQVSGATLGKMLRVSDTASSAIPQVQSAKSLESLDPSPIRFRSLPRAEQGTIERITQAYEQSHGTETHAPVCFKPIRLSSLSHGGPGEPSCQRNASRVDETGMDKAGSMWVMSGSTDAHKDQAGSTCSVSSSTGAHKDQAGAECSVPSSTGAYKGRAGLGGSALAPTGVNVGLDAS